jgi:hypothetical protein
VEVKQEANHTGLLVIRWSQWQAECGRANAKSPADHVHVIASRCAPARLMSEKTQTSTLGSIATASGLDDGVSVDNETIVKSKALGDATRTTTSYEF